MKKKEKKKKDLCCSELDWQTTEVFFFFFPFGDKREMNQRHFHSHATNLLHNPFNMMQKWHYDTDAELKREHFNVTKLIPTLAWIMHQKLPSWLLFTRSRNIHDAGGFRRRKQFRSVPTVCTSLLPAHIMSSPIKDFYLLWWEPGSETFACLTDSHPVC